MSRWAVGVGPLALVALERTRLTKRNELPFRRRFRWFPFASGGLVGSGGCGEPQFRRAVYIPVSIRSVFSRLGLFLPSPVLRRGPVYRRLCCSDGRRRGGEDVFHLVFDGSFFAVLGFLVSVFCDSSRLGLGFQSLLSFSGMGFAVGKWVSVLFHERGLHSNIFICRGFDFGELLFVPFLCADFQILCVLSWVACASHVFGGAKSVFYIRPAAWWSLGAFAGDVFIGIFCCYSLVHRRSFMS